MSFDFILYTVCISPHQLPLIREIVKSLGKERCLYIYSERLDEGRSHLGWSEETEPWLIYEKERPLFCRNVMEECKVLMSGIRDFTLFEARALQHKITLYSSERWFKPIPISHWRSIKNIYFPGWMKMFHPSYFSLLIRFRKLLLSESNYSFFYFPISMNAARDAALICCGYRTINFYRKAGGEVCYCQEKKNVWQKKLRLWGYFVEQSTVEKKKLVEMRDKQRIEVKTKLRPLKILWVGRMLALKNVDTIVRAIRILNERYRLNVTLTLVGDGPEKLSLMRLAQGLDVHFRSFVPIDEIRGIIREHDLYVFASNSFDGWGAVVSEALEEQMYVLASRQSGVGATVLPEHCLFDCRNAQELASRILDFDNLPRVDATPWSAREASKYLVQNFLS